TDSPRTLGVRNQSGVGLMTRHLAFRVLAAGIGFAVLVPSTATAQVPANPTFSKDIAPIFQAKCEACHRADSIAPMTLRTYAESRPWARSIKAKVESR